MTSYQTDSWFVPGGAVIDESRQVKLRLRPPETWLKVELRLPRVAPSMNTNVTRGRGQEFQRLKKEWQAEIEVELMIARSKRPALYKSYQRALAGCFMRFAIARQHRDAPNFEPLVAKALGDALQNFGAIPDDDSLHFFFGGVEIDQERGADRTLIWIYLQPQEA
jgi:hypothetical protein